MEEEIIVEGDFPANSHKSKNNKPIEKVTVNEVVEVKPGIGNLFKDIFSPEHLVGLVGYIATSVVVPAIKTMIYEAGTKGLERAMWGDEPSRPNLSRGPINYSGISTQRAVTKRPQEPSSRNADNFVFGTRGEAESVLDNLSALIETYGHASVADFYQLVGKTSDYTDNKWGWTNLRGARVNRDFHGGYGITLPKATPV